MTPSPNNPSRIRAYAVILFLGVLAALAAFYWRGKKLDAREGTRSALLYDTAIGSVRVTGPSVTGTSNTSSAPQSSPADSPGSMPVGNTASLSMKRAVNLPVPTLSVTVPPPLVEYRLPVDVYGRLRTKTIEDLTKKSVPLFIKETEKQNTNKELLDLAYKVDSRKVNDAIGLNVRLQISRRVYSHPDSVEGANLVIKVYEAQTDYAWVAPKDIEAALDALIKELTTTLEAELKRANAPEPATKDE